jgi:hypothetical protein
VPSNVFADRHNAELSLRRHRNGCCSVKATRLAEDRLGFAQLYWELHERIMANACDRLHRTESLQDIIDRRLPADPARSGCHGRTCWNARRIKLGAQVHADVILWLRSIKGIAERNPLD